MAVTINGTTGVAVPLGTAAAPGVVNTTSSTTGIYYPTSTTLGLSTNGTNAMTIDASQVITGTAGNLMLVQGTAQASTSGTSITFSSIPSWVKRITVMFNGVSTNGASPYIIQIGSGSTTTTGYISFGVNGNTASIVGAAFTTGMAVINVTIAASTYSGVATISNISGNTWTYSAQLGSGSGAWGLGAGSSPALSGALDRVVITTVNGTDTFDAGSINIQYE